MQSEWLLVSDSALKYASLITASAMLWSILVDPMQYLANVILDVPSVFIL